MRATNVSVMGLNVEVRHNEDYVLLYETEPSTYKVIYWRNYQFFGELTPETGEVETRKIVQKALYRWLVFEKNGKNKEKYDVREEAFVKWVEDTYYHFYGLLDYELILAYENIMQQLQEAISDKLAGLASRSGKTERNRKVEELQHLQTIYENELEKRGF